MPDANAIPHIDLGPYLAAEPGALDRAAAELRHALTEIGFYTIVNHGVPSALVHEVYRQVAQFHARPLDEKLRIKLDKHNVGYLPMMCPERKGIETTKRYTLSTLPRGFSTCPERKGIETFTALASLPWT